MGEVGSTSDATTQTTLATWTVVVDDPELSQEYTFVVDASDAESAKREGARLAVICDAEKKTCRGVALVAVGYRAAAQHNSIVEECMRWAEATEQKRA